jgi:GT2 family glycosyltransferase
MSDDDHAATRPVLYVLGACQLFRTSLARIAGPFDDTVFLGWDDADWCIRIRDAGGEIFYFPEAEVIHSYRRLSRKRPVSRAAWKMLVAHARFQWKYRNRRRELIRLGDQLDRSAASSRTGQLPAA